MGKARRNPREGREGGRKGLSGGRADWLCHSLVEMLCDFCMEL